MSALPPRTLSPLSFWRRMPPLKVTPWSGLKDSSLHCSISFKISQVPQICSGWCPRGDLIWPFWSSFSSMNTLWAPTRLGDSFIFLSFCFFKRVWLCKLSRLFCRMTFSSCLSQLSSQLDAVYEFLIGRSEKWCFAIFSASYLEAHWSHLVPIS